MTVRVRLDLAYDGTRFAGWARQPGLRTVEGTLIDALALITRSTVTLTVAGRTDSGVHARHQVAHIDVPIDTWSALPGRSDRSPQDALVARLGGVLPNDVVVFAATRVTAHFDARFAALHRRYRYRISDDPTTRDPIRRWDVLWHRRPLNVAAMDEASQALRGEHDFAAYAKPRDGATTVRELHTYSWQRLTDGPERGLVVATVQADAFCHNMVRALVGAAIAVGEGRKPVTWAREVLDAGRRDPGVAVMPPHGLTLEHVEYPTSPHGDDDAALAARQSVTRAVRG